MESELRHGPIGQRCVHLCVDMQRMFAEATEWHAPWMQRISPVVERIVEQHPAETVFTRFVPARRSGEGEGTWRRYYERWASMTLERLGTGMIDILPALNRFVPPARIVDKDVYSPWKTERLHALLKARSTDTLVVTGGETDVCVLATVLGAVDRGYRVIVVTDALCSSSDQAHDASLSVYRTRYAEQIETAASECVLRAWSLSDGERCSSAGR